MSGPSVSSTSRSTAAKKNELHAFMLLCNDLENELAMICQFRACDIVYTYIILYCVIVSVAFNYHQTSVSS